MTLTVMTGLRARGYAVDLLLERGEGAYLAAVPPDIQVRALERAHKWRSCRRLLARWPSQGLRLALRMLGRRFEYVPLGCLESLIAYLENDRPDVLLVAAGRIPFLALWAKRLANSSTRIVVVEHSTPSARLLGVADATRESKRLTYRRTLMRALYPTADRLAAVSKGAAADVADIVGIAAERIAILSNPVVEDGFETAAAGSSAVHMPTGTAPIVIAAGRLAPEKDFETLIDAFAVAAGDDRFTARLVILGEGAGRAALAARIAAHGLAARIFLPGWVDNPRAYMTRADLFVLSSRFEGQPLALIEALACGCPVVATNCRSGPHEILDGGRHGRLVPVGEPRALAAAIAASLDERADREALKARASMFRVGPALDRYETLIRSCIDGQM